MLYKKEIDSCGVIERGDGSKEIVMYGAGNDDRLGEYNFKNKINQIITATWCSG